MMKRNLMFLALATLGLASCNGGFKKGDGGLLYNILVDKGGPKIQEGDFISVQMVVKTDGDSVLFSTYETGHSSLTLLPKPQSRGDIYAGIKLLAEGDSATIKTCMDSLFKKGQRRPPFKGKYIVYQVKVEKVIAKGKLPDSVFRKNIEAYMKVQTDMMRKEEPVQIKKYIADNKLTVTTTPSGLNYAITQQGSGDKPAAGDTAFVNYTVKFLSNKILESSLKEVAIKNKTYNPMMKYTPLHVSLGTHGVIQGLDEGLLLLNKGSKATFVIPSRLAYGEQGNQAIPPFSPLVFEVEVVNIVHPDPNAKKLAPPMPVAPVQIQRPVAKK